MFILSIWLIDGQKWSWNSITSEIPSDARSEQGGTRIGELLKQYWPSPRKFWEDFSQRSHT